MPVSHSTVLEVLKRAHRVSITEDENGWRWTCSCGQAGGTATRTRGYSEGAATRHLHAAEKLVTARLDANAKKKRAKPAERDR